MASGVQWDAYDPNDILNPDSCYRRVPYQETKRKPNIFNYFLKIQTPEFRKLNPELKQVRRQLTEIWKAMNYAEKTEYEFNFKKYRQFLSNIFYQVEDQNGCRNGRSGNE